MNALEYIKSNLNISDISSSTANGLRIACNTCLDCDCQDGDCSI